jgi:PmbA protein
MLEQLMQKADQAEVFEISSEATKIGFEANQIKSFEVEETRGMAVRVLVNGRLGFAASSDLQATDQLVTNALESARFGDTVNLRFPEFQAGPQVQVYDEQMAGLSIDRLAGVGKEVIAVIREADPDANVTIQLERRVRRTTVRNSTGAEVSVEKTPFTLQVMVQRVRGDDVILLFDLFSTAIWEEGYLQLAHRLAEKLRLAQRVATLSSGRMPVLFSPSGGTVLGLPLMLGLNGKDALQGASPMAGREGELLFDQKLTLVDDPTLKGRPGSASHDDEGVPRRRRTLVEEGVLQGFIYDLKTAVQAGTEPTGNGERGLFSLPSPGFSNLVLESGATPVADMFAGVEEGLLVESPLGLGQGNVISGAFSNNLSLAFKIERGEIVGRVKDVSIAGDIYTDLRSIDALSQESEWVYGGFCLPYILLPQLNVVTKAG